MQFATKPIQQYPPHRRHVDTLPWEIKNSIFLQMWKKTQSNIAFLITSGFVIHPQILLFPHTDCKYDFPCHCSIAYLLLPSICARTEENV